MDDLTRRFLACAPLGPGKQDFSEFLCMLMGITRFLHRLPPRFAANVLQKVVSSSSFTCADENIQESVYSLLSETLARNPASPSYSFHFLAADRMAGPVAIRTDDSTVNVLVKDGSTGFRVWEAAKVLLSYLVKNQEIVRGKSVLELGAGTGFVGIGLGLLGVCTEIVITDVHAQVLARISESINESGLEDERVRVACLDWGNFQAENFAQTEVLVAADVVYDPSLIPELTGALEALLKARRGRFGLVCCAARTESTIQSFCQAVQERNLVCEEVMRAGIHEDGLLLKSLVYGNEISSDMVIFKIYY